METLYIKTERLEIRTLKSFDLSDFHAYRSNPQVVKYQGFDVMNLEQADEFIQGQIDKQFGKAEEWVQYGIELKQTGKLIGDCAIKLQHDVRIAEVGITISHHQQQKGYAKEVFVGIINYLFYTRGVLRIVEIVDVENIPSINLLKSTGFRQEGHFIENIFFKGKWGSEFQYALLKREWDEQTNQK